MKNQVIKSVNPEDGPKIVEYFKGLGVDTLGCFGAMCESDGDRAVYYGVINDDFGCYTLGEVKAANAEIITLPTENKYPKVMEVSVSGNNWFRRVVFAEKNGKFIAWAGAATIEEAEHIVSANTWNFARETNPTKITRAEIAEKFGTTNFEIIDLICLK